ncbi:MAG: SusE domain-containing protein [Alistipes sp.]
MMKYIKYIMTMFAAAATLTACDTELETVGLPDASTYIAPVLNAHDAVVVNIDNVKTEEVTFTYSKADFGVPTAIQYSLYLKLGERSTLAARSFSTSITMGKADFNGIVVNTLKVPANSSADIEAYIVAQMGTTEVVTPASNNITFNVKTFKAALRNLYVPGWFQGWAPEKAPKIWETSGGSNVYEGLFNFTEDVAGTPGFSGFKIIDSPDWDHGNWGFDKFKVDKNFTAASDGNLQLKPGIWKIKVTLISSAERTIEATPVTSVNMLGSFGGWDAGEVDMTYSPVTNVWTSPVVTFTDGLDFLVRLNKSWDFKLGDSGERDQELGGVNLVSYGGENILVPAAGSYIMKLYADRAPYVLVMEKQ